jgi:oligoendopeptidase F
MKGIDVQQQETNKKDLKNRNKKIRNNRNEIEEHYLWNLSELYQSNQEWQDGKDRLRHEMKNVSSFKGRLKHSAKDLLACLKFQSRIEQELEKLYRYASMLSDEDTRIANHIGMKQQIAQIATEFEVMTSFIEPELIQMHEQKLKNYLEEESALAPYRMYLLDLIRRKEHLLSTEEETILNHAGLIANSSYHIFTIFSNAEFPYPKVTLKNGRRVLLDHAGYALYRALQDREDRESVFRSFWKVMGKFMGTLGAQLDANVKKDIFYARSRKYDSSLIHALDKDNIPLSVYKKLILNVNHNLPTFHRYLKLRKQMLGVDQLKYSDLYAPIVPHYTLTYSIEEAKEVILNALSPLGSDYTGIVEQAFQNRWIDVFPNRGKRSGAYCSDGDYDLHPYILLNYNGQLNDVGTVAHELGHAMHTYLSNRNQPYPLSQYSIFTAEVASTFNEILLHHYLVENISDPQTRQSILMEHLDKMKGTIFRQTLFAEFELAIHEKVEKGEPLTGETLTELYGQLLKRYYGHESSVCEIGEDVMMEWAYVPHFYYHFYVYQYATSFTASVALVENVLRNKNHAVDCYLSFLSSGKSDYPLALLKQAGVDMTTEEPFQQAMTVMNRTMDQIMQIIGSFKDNPLGLK